jgi:hypothetical protein
MGLGEYPMPTARNNLFLPTLFFKFLNFNVKKYGTTVVIWFLLAQSRDCPVVSVCPLRGGLA